MNNSQDLISIILPLYNKEEFLDAQLESIYFQSYKNRELIIVNDSSNDSSKEIALLRQRRMGNNCYLIDNEINLGMNASIEKGLQFAKGKYIAYCDADDIRVRNKLELQYTFLKKGSYDLVYCDMTTIDENGSILKPSYIQSIHSIENNTNKLNFQKFVCANHVTATSILFDTVLINEIRPLPKILYQDRRTLLNASYLNKSIGFQNISLVYYRRFSASMSVLDSQDIKIMSKYKDYMNELLLHIQKKPYKNEMYIRFLNIKIEVLDVMIHKQRTKLSFVGKVWNIMSSIHMRIYFYRILKQYRF